ncbi:gliding motility-associated C-terminal domain-containing protein [Winogradskyella helgolandensis]|uniref:gliding motility-associated C-terminal domain-containing protein n=1 Tax=Winogradskyella helgolandensis TaxID=2697010 RepID=UPI0015CA73D9|nr:gliding motility-associated C-terminal domain-containing protein [Winogradskyella helgolandensis]
MNAIKNPSGIKVILFCCVFFFSIQVRAQLGFCSGNSGDPIFSENFGTGTVNSVLPDGTTTYYYTDGFPDDGFYTLGNGSFGNGFDWHEVEDHTPGDTDGKFLMVNAGFSAGEFYRTTISGLCETTTYEFSAWLFNLVKIPGFCHDLGIEIPFNVSFQIWDSTDTNLLASGDTGDVYGTPDPVWEQYGLVFQTLANQHEVILKMINNGDGGCGNDLAIDDIAFKACGDFVAVTDEQNNTSADICNSDMPYSLTLTATPDFAVFSSHFYQWQESSDGITWTDIAGETDQTLEVSVASSSFYRTKIAEVATNLDNDQCILLSDVFEISVNANPDAPISSGDMPFICNISEALLSVTVPSNMEVNWYDNAVGGNLLQADNLSYTATALGTYYAEAVDLTTGCISTTRTAVSAISELPSSPVSNGDVDFNCSLEEAILSVSVPSGVTVNWYDNAVGGNLLQADSFTYTATTLGTYYAEAVDDTTGCVSASRTAVSAVSALPAAPISNGDIDFNCDFNEALLSVSAPSGVTVNWYDSASGGILLLSNSLNYTVSLEGTYYAETIDDITGCVSSTRAAVSTSIFAPNEPMSDGDVDYDCAINGAILSVSVPSGVIVNWYSSETSSDILLANSTTFTVSDQEVYYAEAVNELTGCTSDFRTSVSISLDSGPQDCFIPQGISPGVSPGQNDNFDLSNFDVTKLEIFNRYGTLVYSKNNYSDEWEGQSNNGDELPVGTYFYTMVYDGGAKTQSSWVYINR